MWAWITSKIFIFEVTFGFYGLDWWERCILHMITLLLGWFILYKSSQFTFICCQGLVHAYKTHEGIWQKWYPINGEIEKLH
ncbi:hypothetical protein O6H91_Y554500 [Diphasiastrum complanatum]|nr:hypothetical protein O6H91_Y554500 [Diphasiastrum complanatum]